MLQIAPYYKSKDINLVFQVILSFIITNYDLILLVLNKKMITVKRYVNNLFQWLLIVNVAHKITLPSIGLLLVHYYSETWKDFQYLALRNKYLQIIYNIVRPAGIMIALVLFVHEITFVDFFVGYALINFSLINLFDYLNEISH
jgi:hypothetical protein